MLLNYDEMAKGLAAAGVPLVKEHLAADAAEAVATADEFGVPVVLKLVSPALVHKSDVGAVLLNIRGHEEVVEATGRLADLAAELSLNEAGWQILVQEMVDGGYANAIDLREEVTIPVSALPDRLADIASRGGRRFSDFLFLPSA